MTYALNPEVTATALGDDLVLLDPRTSTLFTLNEVGRVVWQALETQPCTLSDLVDIVTAEFEVSAERAGQDLASLLAALRDAGLVTGS